MSSTVGPSSSPPATDPTGLGLVIDPAPVTAAITIQQSWDNLMQRIGIYGVKLVAAGSLHLDIVDRITKTNSRNLPL